MTAMLKAVKRTLSQLNDEHDEALRRYEDCIKAMEAKAGHHLYDGIMQELQDDTLVCKELRHLVRLL